jgi:hypothetical protein
MAKLGAAEATHLYGFGSWSYKDIAERNTLYQSDESGKNEAFPHYHYLRLGFLDP